MKSDTAEGHRGHFPRAHLQAHVGSVWRSEVCRWHSSLFMVWVAGRQHEASCPQHTWKGCRAWLQGDSFGHWKDNSPYLLLWRQQSRQYANALRIAAVRLLSYRTHSHAFRLAVPVKSPLVLSCRQQSVGRKVAGMLDAAKSGTSEAQAPHDRFVDLSSLL